MNSKTKQFNNKKNGEMFFVIRLAWIAFDVSFFARLALTHLLLNELFQFEKFARFFVLFDRKNQLFKNPTLFNSNKI